MTVVDLQCVLVDQLNDLWKSGKMGYHDYQEAVHELETAVWSTAAGSEKAAMVATADHYGLDVPAGERR